MWQKKTFICRMPVRKTKEISYCQYCCSKYHRIVCCYKNPTCPRFNTKHLCKICVQYLKGSLSERGPPMVPPSKKKQTNIRVLNQRKTFLTQCTIKHRKPQKINSIDYLPNIKATWESRLPHPCLFQCLHNIYVSNVLGYGNQNFHLKMCNLKSCILDQVTPNTTVTKWLSSTTTPDMDTQICKGNSASTRGYKSKYEVVVGTGHTQVLGREISLPVGNGDPPRDYYIYKSGGGRDPSQESYTGRNNNPLPWVL